MFKGMKIKSKLVFGFITVAIIAGIICTIGISEVTKINKADNGMFETVVIPLGICTDVTATYQKIRITVRDILLADNLDERESKHGILLGLSSKFDSLMTLYEPTMIDEIDRKNFEQLKQDKKEYLEQLPNFKSLIKLEK